MHVRSYQTTDAEVWNSFVGRSKNGTFLFNRNYMDYHADRFHDSSFLFSGENGRTIGLFPASRHGSTVISHGGLTYGGIICDSSMKSGVMLRLFDALLKELQSKGVGRLVYKPVPHVYHRNPAEDDLYALYRFGAVLFRRDLSSTIDCNGTWKISENRLRGVRKALNTGVATVRSEDFDTFFSFHNQLLLSKHGVQAVHTPSEMALLARRFTANIKLVAAMLEGQMVAGVIVYDNDTCAHFQYISSTEVGRECGALDLLLYRLIESYADSRRYISFGVSTENEGRHLNANLVHQKEQFGARTVVHDFYELNI